MTWRGLQSAQSQEFLTMSAPGERAAASSPAACIPRPENLLLHPVDPAFALRRLAPARPCSAIRQQAPVLLPAKEPQPVAPHETAPAELVAGARTGLRSRTSRPHPLTHRR